MKNIIKTIAASTILFFVSGCASMAPDYTRPEAPVSETFKSEQISTPNAGKIDLKVENVADVGWREVFTGPDLQVLIQTALTNNRDFKQTALNLQMYQAQYRIQRSAIYPNISVDGYGLKERGISGDSHTTYETYSLQVGTTSWELDFFGRVQSLKNQALENYLAMEESLKSSQISLISQVVNAYLTLLTDRELLKISEETRTIEEESYALIEQRVDAGIGDQLDLAQARTSLEAVKVNIPLYRRQLAQDIHNLTLLTGGPVPANLLGTDKVLTDVTPMTVLPDSLDSAVLLQRPDILAAEHQLMAANANIGAARAAFFPKISLTATAGVMSTDLSDLFNDSGVFTFMPSISLPIFNAGRLKAELDVAEIQKELNIAQYEYAIQAAFKEVADSLVALETYDEQVSSQKANLDANQLYYDHAKSRYDEGVDSFLTLLDAQRSLYSAKQNYLTMLLSNMVNRVNLYKVLGGGWKETSAQ